VCVVPDAIMMYNGEPGPCLISELLALDRFNKEQNKKYAPEIFAFYKEQLGIENTRYIYQAIMILSARLCRNVRENTINVTIRIN